VKARGQESFVRRQKTRSGLYLLPMSLWLLLIFDCAVGGEDFTALCADRTAVEHVYYNHRLGTKPPFEQTMPTVLVEKLVLEDLHKETVLKKNYGVEITPVLLAAEVQRINTTSRAPDVLAELKAALGNDTNRFARTVAEPILVERILRDKFDNDDALHASQRQQAESIRTHLLAAGRDHAGLDNELALFKQLSSNQVTETTWQLGKPPEEPQADDRELTEAQKRFGPNAQVLSAPHEEAGEPKFYFNDLPPELRQVLRAQLRQPGDVSAVIETPGGFLLYLCKEKSAAALTVAALPIPKRNYEQWLAEQNATIL